MAQASLAMSGIGAVTSMIGQQQSAAAQSAAAHYNAQVARNNQQIAQQNADLAQQEGQARLTQQRMKSRSLMGAQRAALAANGLEIGSGSALDLQADSAMLSEWDARMIQYNTDKSAWNYTVQGQDFGAKAGLLDAQGTWASAAGNVAGMNSLLGGVGSAADKLYMFKKDGVPF
ncbi:MAG: hypothetical protein HQM01_08265 [Magnetococcales bacterium]|nr:hypothetical protein [Magnetococcales bacterium]